MRFWSFHPKLLDKIGLSRNINETIAGYKAFCKTGEGYPKNWEKHRQLIRFQKLSRGDLAIKDYIQFLLMIWHNKKLDEINVENFPMNLTLGYLTVTDKQLRYEWQHYLGKIKKRSPNLYKKMMHITQPEPHPLFKVVKGEIEPWEKIKK